MSSKNLDGNPKIGYSHLAGKQEHTQLDQHIKAHNLLIGKVKSMGDRVSGGEKVTFEMLSFPEDWICRHILLVDRHCGEELSSYLRAE